MKWFKIGIGLFIAVLACLLMVWIFAPGQNILSAKDKTKALQGLLGRDPHLDVQELPTTWLIHKTAFVQYDYPSWAKIYATDNAKATTGNTLDSFSFALLDQHISATVQVVQFTGALTEYPAVALRLVQNTLYTPTATQTASMSFAKEQDIVERSFFFLKNGKVVSVAVTGYTDSDVENIYQKIIASLKIY